MRFVDVIFPVALWTSSTHLNYHVSYVGDVGMVKDSECSRTGETGESMATPCHWL